MNINELTKLRKGKKLVFTNGCFDILHRGHLHLLKEAKKMGDILVVGLNSDVSVRRLKGMNRPVKDERTRTEILEALVYVDHVIIFGEDTPAGLLAELRPDVLVKGGDYSKEEIVGYDLLTSYGGEVHIVPYLEGNSSSSLIDKID